jgi:hypothetical protein
VYFVQFRCWVITYRDKVVGVFVDFSCAASIGSKALPVLPQAPYGGQRSAAATTPAGSFVQEIERCLESRAWHKFVIVCTNYLEAKVMNLKN